MVKKEREKIIYKSAVVTRTPKPSLFNMRASLRCVRIRITYKHSAYSPHSPWTPPKHTPPTSLKPSIYCSDYRFCFRWPYTFICPIPL